MNRTEKHRVTIGPLLLEAVAPDSVFLVSCALPQLLELMVPELNSVSEMVL